MDILQLAYIVVKKNCKCGLCKANAFLWMLKCKGIVQVLHSEFSLQVLVR